MSCFPDLPEPVETSLTGEHWCRPGTDQNHALLLLYWIKGFHPAQKISELLILKFCNSISEVYAWEEQRSWWSNCWKTGHVRSSWGYRNCLALRKGGWVKISSLSTATWKEVVTRWVFVSSQVISDRTWSNRHRLHQGRFSLDIMKNFFMKKVVRHWHRAAQGSGGVPIPGSI